MKNIDILKNSNCVEILAFREHPYKKGKEILKSIKVIKDYDYILQDKVGTCIMFVKKKGRMLLVIDRIENEYIVKITKNSLGEAVIIVD